jgi:hypothetical protein
MSILLLCKICLNFDERYNFRRGWGGGELATTLLMGSTAPVSKYTEIQLDPPTERAHLGDQVVDVDMLN